MGRWLEMIDHYITTINDIPTRNLVGPLVASLEPKPFVPGGYTQSRGWSWDTKTWYWLDDQALKCGEPHNKPHPIHEILPNLGGFQEIIAPKWVLLWACLRIGHPKVSWLIIIFLGKCHLESISIHVQTHPNVRLWHVAHPNVNIYKFLPIVSPHHVWF